MPAEISVGVAGHEHHREPAVLGGGRDPPERGGQRRLLPRLGGFGGDRRRMGGAVTGGKQRQDQHGERASVGHGRLEFWSTLKPSRYSREYIPQELGGSVKGHTSLLHCLPLPNAPDSTYESVSE
jgi:hypothetical protein